MELKQAMLRLFMLLLTLILSSSCASSAPVCDWKLWTLHAGQTQLEGEGNKPLMCTDPGVPDMVCLTRENLANLLTCGGRTAPGPAVPAGLELDEPKK